MRRNDFIVTSKYKPDANHTEKWIDGQFYVLEKFGEVVRCVYDRWHNGEHRIRIPGNPVAYKIGEVRQMGFTVTAPHIGRAAHSVNIPKGGY